LDLKTILLLFTSTSLGAIVVGTICSGQPNFQKNSVSRAATSTARATWAIVILTAVTIGVSLSQYRIFDRQLTVMQGQLDALERDERPYVWITDKLLQPQFHPAGGTDLPIGQIVWTWEFTNFGNGRAIGLSSKDYIRMGPNSVFKRSFGTKGEAYGGDIPKGKTNFNTTISEPIQKADFDRLLAIDGGISILIEMKFSDLIGKTQETAVCLVNLASGAIQLANPAECGKFKEP
jgi:hypothetical protein